MKQFNMHVMRIPDREERSRKKRKKEWPNDSEKYGGVG